MIPVREREPPVEWQQPQWQQPSPHYQAAPHDRRGPWAWLLLVAAIIALVVVVLIV
jgi:hypothetical protein